MDFFAHQARARQRSRQLVVLFTLTVLAIVAAVALIALLTMGQPAPPGASWQQWLRLNQPTLLWSAVITAGLILLASLFRAAQLRGGGGAVARAMGGTPILPDTSDPQHRQLRNIVEEVAIASGVPVPEVYVLEHEPGLNAFAAGWGTGDAAVAVTRGALEQFTREEIQGVIAHEFSHILNGDMRLNIRVMAVLFGILSLTVVGRVLLHAGSRRAMVGRRGRDQQGAEAALLLVGLALVVVGAIGVLGARLIKAAVSRQRELLADASAVQFTRHPQGLAGALKKIGWGHSGSALQASDAEEVSHMLFASGRLRSLFATHPPIEQRIRAIDPSFRPEQMRRPSYAEASATAERRAAAGLAPAFAPNVAVQPEAMAALVGNPQPAHYAHAEALRVGLPPALAEAAREQGRAPALALALVLSAEPAVREKQLALVGERAGSAAERAATGLYEALAGLGPAYRLPLFELSVPALKLRTPAQLNAIADIADALVHLDGRVSVSEFALSRLLHKLARSSERPDRRARPVKLAQARDALATVFATLAHVGHRDAHAALGAYRAGLARVLSSAPPLAERPAPTDTAWVDALDAALAQLEGLVPEEQPKLVEGLFATTIHDGQLTLDEAELLRAVCALLDCPLPSLNLPIDSAR
ncbi:M48 family metallopeptidase [Ectothiorhodospiraceae bacterium 2226]|nr:M48 family metallopeptidase [Ectothiorhodospiraceae bacterium 2226]